MFRTTLAGLRARKGRLTLTAVAVVLGVTFVAGTFGFTATVKAAFFERFAAQARHVDVAVEPPARTGKSRPELPESVLSAVRAVPGVASVEGRMSGTAALLDRSGKVVAAGESPGVAVDLPADPRFRDFTLVTGSLPSSTAEALLDTDTAARQRLRAGDSVTVLGPHQVRTSVRITGTVDLGVNKQLESSGASVLVLPADGVRAITGVTGYDRIEVAAAPGVGQAVLASGVRAVAGAAATVVTGDRLARDLANSVTHQVDLFLQGLLIFGLVALVVAALVIYNTFKIVIAQRTRELALLRCVGATRRQVFLSVVTEAAVVGLAGSAAGVVVGLGVALVLPPLLNLTGAGIPASGLVVNPAGVLGGLVAGTAVTVAAALLPAVLSTRVAPMAALRAQPESRIGDVRLRVFRVVTAVLLGAAGVVLAALGIPQGRSGLFTVAGGGVLFFLATLTAGPLLVGPMTAALGWLPRRLGGVPVRMALGGARRNPGRTSTSMIALTVGVGLMTLFSVVLATAGRFATDQMDQHYPVDYLVSPMGSGTTIPPSVAAGLRRRPEIASVAELRKDSRGRLGTGRVDVAALDPSAYRLAYRPQLSAGSLNGLRDGEIALYGREATRLRARVGDTVALTAAGGVRSFRVVAVYTSRFAQENALISWADFTRSYGPGGDDTLMVLAGHGVAASDSRAAVDQLTANLPLLQVRSIASYKAQLNSAIDQVTALLGALLATAVVIALFGIANTLSLSVLERTRESSLLRALGLTRSQLRRMLSVEALLTGLMGGLLGVVLGAGFGWAVSLAFLHDSGGGHVAFPVGRIAGYLTVAALAGVLAAFVPARRASRTPIIKGLAE
jgi:putative ABC transport system permease protein